MSNTYEVNLNQSSAQKALGQSVYHDPSLMQTQSLVDVNNYVCFKEKYQLCKSNQFNHFWSSEKKVGRWRRCEVPDQSSTDRGKGKPMHPKNSPFNHESQVSTFDQTNNV